MTAIALPDVESLLSDKSHFRPHATVHRKIKVDSWDIRDPSSEKEAFDSYMEILSILNGKIQSMLFAKNRPSGTPSVVSAARGLHLGMPLSPNTSLHGCQHIRE